MLNVNFTKTGLTAVSCLLVCLALTAQAADYSLSQETIPLSGNSGSSDNYQFDAVIGQPGAGQSVSTNYIFVHGFSWIGEMSSSTPPEPEPEIEILPAPQGYPEAWRFIVIEPVSSTPDITLPPAPPIATTSPETPGLSTTTTPIDLPPCPPATEETAGEASSSPSQSCQKPTASTTRPTSFPTQIKNQLQAVNDFVVQQISSPDNWCFYIISLLIIIIIFLMIIIVFRKKKK